MTSYIFADNFADPERVAAYSASSSQTNFPLSNLLSTTRRSKVWRSNGYFEIPSGGLLLAFKETVAASYWSATISEGSYTSFSSLATEIKTQMEAVGDSTYTITQDATTGKVKISSNGAGGGGVFQIVWTLSTGMADLLGFDSSTDDTGALTYTANVLRINSGEWIKFDMGISTNPEGFALVTARNTPMSFSGTAVVKLQGNETDVWTGPSYEKTLDLNEDIIWATKANSSEGLHTEALRFWRVYFDDKDNPQGFLEAGAIFLGNSIPMTRGRVQIPFSADYLDASVTVYSESGQSISDEKHVSESFKVDMFGLTKADKEAFDDFFEDYKTVKAFFIQFDPEAAMGTTSGNYFRYVKMTGAPSWEMPFPGVFGVSFTVREEL